VRVDIESLCAYTLANMHRGVIGVASGLEWARSRLLFWSSEEYRVVLNGLDEGGALHCVRAV